jgi:hypothetical protein
MSRGVDTAHGRLTANTAHDGYRSLFGLGRERPFECLASMQERHPLDCAPLSSLRFQNTSAERHALIANCDPREFPRAVAIHRRRSTECRRPLPSSRKSCTASALSSRSERNNRRTTGKARSRGKCRLEVHNHPRAAFRSISSFSRAALFSSPTTVTPFMASSSASVASSGRPLVRQILPKRAAVSRRS